MKFDAVKNTCEQLCEPERQIFIPPRVEGEAGTCQNCNPNCDKCAGTVDTCTTCKEGLGLVLNTDYTCDTTCNSDSQTPIEGICKECEEPCASCSGTTDNCESCIPEYYLYLGTECVQYCPEKYYNDTESMICVYEGLVCPDGFVINDSKDGCIPTTYDCDEGYVINDAKNACVPAPGSPVPFPFLLIAIFICFLVLGSYLKDKQFTKVRTNLIALIGSLEIILYVMMVLYALRDG